MRSLALIPIFILFSACGGKSRWFSENPSVDPIYQKAFEVNGGPPFDTITVNHSECTECLDAYVLSGRINVPPTLRKYFGDTLGARTDLILTGEYPNYYFDPMSLRHDPGKILILAGKLIAADSMNSWGLRPVFYVENWW